MNFRNLFILIIVFYFLVLLQTSFFVHFAIFGIIPNFALFLVIIINLFEKSKNLFSPGVFVAVIAGFFLDIYSSRPIGFYTLISVGIAIAIKIILKKYVRIPLSERL